MPLFPGTTLRIKAKCWMRNLGLLCRRKEHRLIFYCANGKIRRKLKIKGIRRSCVSHFGVEGFMTYGGFSISAKDQTRPFSKEFE